jgi:hypothetical protein
MTTMSVSPSRHCPARLPRKGPHREAHEQFRENTETCGAWSPKWEQAQLERVTGIEPAWPAWKAALRKTQFGSLPLMKHRIQETLFLRNSKRA